MFSRILAIVMVVVAVPCMSRGQAVFFDVSPPGTPIPTTPGQIPTTQPVEVVEPGALVPYELGVFVQLTPTLPDVNGLASFDVNILTTLGRLQPPLSSFNAIVQEAFPVSVSLGTPTDDDILNITGMQDLAGITSSSIALGRRQIIGTGQFVTPFTEGDFDATVTGTASVLNTGVNPFQPTLQPADVGISRGFTIQTRKTTTSPAEENEPIDSGTNLVDICFPSGTTTLLPGCMLGLVGMRCCYGRKRMSV